MVGTTLLRNYKLYLCLIFLLSLMIRIYLCMITKGYVEDHQFFIQWADALRNYSVGKSYLSVDNMNYPPLFIFFLNIYIFFTDWFGLSLVKGGFWVRVPSLLLDAGMLIVFLLLTKKVQPVQRVVVFAFLSLNPVLVLAGPIWGQIDSLHSTLIVLVLFHMKRPSVAGLFFALALLTKFQSIMILPVIGFFYLWEIIRTRSLRNTLVFILGFCLPIAGTIIYFLLSGSLFAMIQQAYGSAVGLYPYASLHAFNIWHYVFGTHPWSMDSTEILYGVTMKNLGFILLFISFCIIGFLMWRQEKRDNNHMLYFGATAVFSFFMLATQMHERYFIPALVCLCFAAAFELRILILASVLTVTGFFNISLVLNQNVSQANSEWVAYINVFLFLAMLWGGTNTKLFLKAKTMKN